MTNHRTNADPMRTQAGWHNLLLPRGSTWTAKMMQEITLAGIVAAAAKAVEGWLSSLGCAIHALASAATEARVTLKLLFSPGPESARIMRERNFDGLVAAVARPWRIDRVRWVSSSTAWQPQLRWLHIMKLQSKHRRTNASRQINPLFRIIFLWMTLICLVFLQMGSASAAHNHIPEEHAPATQDLSRPVAQASPLENAREQERKGRYLQALESYAALAADPDPDIRLQARMGQARCLLRMDHPEAALIRLEPLPDTPASTLEAQQIALAGEILLHLNRNEAAFQQLRKLTHMPEILAEPWSGSAFANLGASALHLNRLDIADVAYRVAMQQFTKFDRSTEASACQRMLQRIANLKEGHRHE